MKKIALVILVLLVAVTGHAANYYFDLASGNDTTGDGSSGNPWKTIDKCTTSRSAGDECRGALTTITTLSGTLTFTNGSTSVATSEDLTAVVSAGNLIGKNSGLEGWWRVASLTSSAITLAYQYWGLSGSGSAVTGYKITPVAASEEYDMMSSGSSGNHIKVSGGWNLSNTTQEGITAFSSTYTNGVDFNAKSWVEFSKFIISETGSYVVSIDAANNYIHDVFAAAGSYYAVYLAYSSFSTFENLVLTGGADKHFHYGNLSTFTNVYSLSCGTGGIYAFTVSGLANLFDNLRIYNSSGSALSINQGSSFNFFKNTIISKTRGGYGIYYGGVENRFHGLTIDNVSTYNFYNGGYAQANLLVIDSSVTAGSSGNFYADTTIPSGYYPSLVYSTTGNDAITYFTHGNIEHDSSADCRSGKCLKFSPTSATVPIIAKVGTVKITSTASDLTLSAYLKDDAGFNGRVFYFPVRNGKWLARTEKTPTTSYVKESEVISTGDLVASEYLDLYVIVTGTAGSVWIDDFSAEQ